MTPQLTTVYVPCPMTGDSNYMQAITGYFLTQEEMEEVIRESREQAIREAADGGWISVKDGLPEGNVTVDVVIKNEYREYRIPNVEYRLADLHNKTNRFESYQHTEDGMRWVDITSYVTHWMPIPKLPNQQSLTAPEGV